MYWLETGLVGTVVRVCCGTYFRPPHSLLFYVFTAPIDYRHAVAPRAHSPQSNETSANETPPCTPEALPAATVYTGARGPGAGRGRGDGEAGDAARGNAVAEDRGKRQRRRQVREGASNLSGDVDDARVSKKEEEAAGKEKA